MLLNKLRAVGGWPAILLSILCGACLALGQPPFDFPWGVFIAVPCLYLLVSGVSFWRGFCLGLLSGAAYFATALHWIVEPFLVDVERHGWMAPFALVLLSAGLALFWALAMGLFAKSKQAGFAGVLLFAALWTLFEYARSTVLTGFPWALLAYVWGGTPIAQIAAFVGPHGLGFLTLMVALASVAAPPRHLSGIAIGLFFFGTAWFATGSRIPDTTEILDTKIRLIQPNAPQHEKWQPENLQMFFDRQIGFTSEPGAVDLIVWPEVAVPYLVDSRLDLNKLIADAAGPSRAVFIGGRRIEDTADGERWFNSAFLLGDEGQIEASYDKAHLVPFGEYLPLPGLFDRFGLTGLAQNAGKFSGGSGDGIVSVDGLPAFRTLICYEVIFPEEILHGQARPGWLLHLTNDGWFGTFSGPYQHLSQARFRAIETGLPLARSANTGVSAMIDPYGRVTDSIGLNQAGYIDVSLPRALPSTVYASLGDKPLVFMLVLLSIGVVALRRRNSTSF